MHRKIPENKRYWKRINEALKGHGEAIDLSLHIYKALLRVWREALQVSFQRMAYRMNSATGLLTLWMNNHLSRLKQQFF